jgi:hypothetical protein
MLLVTSILLLTSCSCPNTSMVNKTKYKWNKRDYEVLEQVKGRCKVHYPNSKCVKRFYKIGEHDYSVLCGKEICK